MYGVGRLNVFELNLFVSSSRIDIGPRDTTLGDLKQKCKESTSDSISL